MNSTANVFRNWEIDSSYKISYDFFSITHEVDVEIRALCKMTVIIDSNWLK